MMLSSDCVLKISIAEKEIKMLELETLFMLVIRGAETRGDGYPPQ